MIKGNKGEWSEFYAFLRVLADKKLFAADENLEKISDRFYIALKVVREEAQLGKKSYDLTDGDKIKIYDDGGQLIGTLDDSKIKSSVSTIFERIKSNPDTTFGIDLADSLMNELSCTQIKARSERKADLVVVIHDRITPVPAELGFSIKSMLGSASTLLNPGATTNFIYEVKGFGGDIGKVNAIKSRRKIKDRMAAIKEAGGTLEYVGMVNDTFRKNLRKIDTKMPEIVADLLNCFYGGDGASVADIVRSMGGNSVLKEKYDLSEDDYEYKVKTFLADVALGMTPSREWDGLTQAHGGYIVVKEDGDIVCYHLYNRDEFREYLYRNTRLETASTGRYGYLSLYEENGKLYIKLNLQIRFLK